MAKVKNTDIVKYFQKAVKEGWGYVWGLNGELYTKERAELNKKNNMPTPPSSRPDIYWTNSCKKWFGKMAADCSGGIIGAIRTKDPSYSDRTANVMKSEFTESGKINTIPEIPGLAVWRSGHIGIYEGDGKILEFRGTAYGAVRTTIATRNFTHWGKIKGVEYGATKKPTAKKEEAKKWTVERLLKRTSPMLRGDDVKELQTRLNANDCDCGKVDGIFGSKTEAAVKKYQKLKKLAVDGKAGKNTITALGGVWKG